MKSYAIVAIPSEDDYVWRISSEKIPHLTLLFLGDRLENVNRVEKFVGHVVDTSLPKFGMDVVRRGVLGDKSADVLFFGEHGRERLEDVRAYLLGNLDILNAYNSTEQFSSWKPHLTLGFPETPANPDKRDYPGTQWVNFDRIALWTGSYEGVEFPLKNDNELSMMSARGVAFLEHYGIKGMKWGVTREQLRTRTATGGKALKKVYMPSQDAKTAQKSQIKAKIGGVRSLNNQEMRQVIARMELEQRYRDLYGERQFHDEAVSRATRYGKKGARWAGRLLNDILKDAGSSWLKRPGSNTSGRSSNRVRAWTTGQQFAGAIDGAVAQKSIGS